MKKIIFVYLFIYSTSAFSLQIEHVKNAELKDLYLYNGSRLLVAPDDGVLIYVSGKANKKVKLKIQVTGNTYLSPGIRISNLRAKEPLITLDKYGDGLFKIGFSLLGEKEVSGKHKKQIKYQIDYID